MEIRKADKTEFFAIKDFYQKRLPHYEVSISDLIYIATIEGQIIGVVRLVEERSHLILRGMQIAPDYQRNGVGSALLQLLDADISNRECFCIPYSHLEDFYGQINFKKIVETEAPLFLQERLQKYLEKNENIIMRRAAT